MLKGDDNALSEAEKAGYKLFKEIGCAGCHHGPAVGGTSFQRMGLFEKYLTNNPSQGRFEVTGKDADRMAFKVPTLRNVELTYPYFHDGAYWNLEKAVDVMATLQLGQELDAESIDNIVAFLHSLTGEQPNFTMPMLPPSTPQTPRPVPFKE